MSCSQELIMTNVFLDRHTKPVGRVCVFVCGRLFNTNALAEGSVAVVEVDGSSRYSMSSSSKTGGSKLHISS